MIFDDLVNRFDAADAAVIAPLAAFDGGIDPSRHQKRPKTFRPGHVPAGKFHYWPRDPGCRKPARPADDDSVPLRQRIWIQKTKSMRSFEYLRRPSDKAGIHRLQTQRFGIAAGRSID